MPIVPKGSKSVVITYTGKLIEVGMLDDGCGCVIEIDGQLTTIVGLSPPDVRGLARHLYQQVRIEITAVSEEAGR